MSDYPRPEYPKKKCEHCHYDVGTNIYTKSHGDGCSYKDAPEGHKRCRTCQDFKPLGEFRKSAANTFDGLNQSCKICASRKILICPHCLGQIETKYENHRMVVNKYVTNSEGSGDTGK